MATRPPGRSRWRAAQARDGGQDLTGREQSAAVPGQRGVLHTEAGLVADPYDGGHPGGAELAQHRTHPVDGQVQDDRPARAVREPDGLQGGFDRALLQGFGAELRRDLGATAPQPVLGPAFRQVQPPVHGDAEGGRGLPDPESLLAAERVPEPGVDAAVNADRALAGLGNGERPHHEGVRGDDPAGAGGERGADRHPVPGGAGDEVVQALLQGGLAEVGGDVPDRLAALGNEQPPQVLLALEPLVPPGQGGEQGVVDLPASALMALPDLGRRLSRTMSMLSPWR